MGGLKNGDGDLAYGTYLNPLEARNGPIVTGCNLSRCTSPSCKRTRFNLIQFPFREDPVSCIARGRAQGQPRFCLMRASFSKILIRYPLKPARITVVNRKLAFMVLWMAIAASGCGPRSEPSATPQALPESEPTRAAPAWVRSDDRAIAMRLSVGSPSVDANEHFQLIAEFRNDSLRPVTVLRPFGDWYLASAVGIKVWNADRRIDYSGPQMTYVIGADAFAVMAPGETIQGKIDMIAENYLGIDKQGTYMLRYDYQYDGRWDTTAAAGGSGIKDAWRGTIVSREVKINRE